MDIVLHAGAHRTGTTSFQHYLRAHQSALGARGIGFWGPWRTRDGLLADVAQPPVHPGAARRAAGRVRINLRRSETRGIAQLVVSDENMLGTPRRSLRQGVLYHDAGQRMARLAQAFGQPGRVVLQIRSLDAWWASAMAHMIPRGEAVPDAARIAAIARSGRSWRHVIADVACACPGSEILVTPFERFGNCPDLLLRAMTGLGDAPPVRAGEFWLNRRPDLPSLRRALAERGEDPERLPGDGQCWQPFDAAQRAALRENYSDDLFWLSAGADGLATLWQETEPAEPGIHPAAGLQERGRHDDGSARGLAQHR